MGHDPGHCPVGCTAAPAAPAHLLLWHSGRMAPDGLSVLLSSGVGAGAPTPARPCLLSLLAASLLSCLAVAKSFLCRAPRATSLLLSLGGKALRQMKSKYRGPALLPARGVPRRWAQLEGPDLAPSRARATGRRRLAGAGNCSQPSRPPRRRAGVPRGPPKRRRGAVEAAGQGWPGWAGGRGPHAPHGPRGPAAGPTHRGPLFALSRPA